MAKKAKKKTGVIRHNIHTRGKKCTTTRRFVPRDIMVLPFNEEKIIGLLMEGYEVRLGSLKSGIRIFPYLNNDYETQRIVAQTHGYFREAIKDCPWEESGEVKHDMNKLDKLRNERNKLMRDAYRLVNVTPDTTVTFNCEKCGHPNTVRVGKKLV